MDPITPSYPRIYCAWLLTAALGTILAQSLGRCLSDGPQPWAALGLVTMALPAALAVLRRSFPRAWVGLGLSLCAAAAALVLAIPGAAAGQAIQLGAVACAQLWGLGVALRQIPRGLEELVRARRQVAGLWGLAGALACAQIWHLCAHPPSGAQSLPLDPSQASPGLALGLHLLQALACPTAHLLQVWQLMSLGATLCTGLLMARWVNGRCGVRIAVLLPLLLVSPALAALLAQADGNLLGLCLALLSLRSFEQRRAGLGAGQLLAALAFVGYPLLILVPLAAQRRLHALAWAGAAVLLSLPPAWWTRYAPGVTWSWDGAPMAALLRPGLEALGLDPACLPGLVLAGQLAGLGLLWIAGGRARETGLAAVQRGEHLGLWLGCLSLGVLLGPRTTPALASLVGLWLLSSVGRAQVGRPDLLTMRGLLWLGLFGMPWIGAVPGAVGAWGQALCVAGLLWLVGWVILRPPPSRLRKALRRSRPRLAGNDVETPGQTLKI